MKSYKYYAILALNVFVLCSCGSSKRIEKSPIETFVMPCSEMVSGNGVLRAWASGKSDNETAARKKAQIAVSADLAAMLGKVVQATTEDYTTNLSENRMGLSKSLLDDKTKVVVEQSLKGATIVCDRWVKDDSTGQYTNYLVMELQGEEYLKSLYEELKKSGVTEIDKDLLEDLFLKNIDKSVKMVEQ